MCWNPNPSGPTTMASHDERPPGGPGWTTDPRQSGKLPHTEVKAAVPSAQPADLPAIADGLVEPDGCTLGSAVPPSDPLDPSGAGDAGDHADRADAHIPEDDGEIDPVLLDLLTRMRAKDRQAVAEFINRYGSRIKRRVRGKLNGPVRRLYDANEMVSTVARRLDQFVRDGRLEADNPRRLWALVGRIADNAAIDKVRIFNRLYQTEGPDGVIAAAMAKKLGDAERVGEGGFVVELDKILGGIKDEKDRKILELWLKDVPHAEIAEILGMTSAAVRKRWQEIKERLRERLGPHLQED